MTQKSPAVIGYKDSRRCLRSQSVVQGASSGPTLQPLDRLIPPIMAVVTNQPGRFAPSDFQTGLCDFCDDCGTCCYGLFCYACLGCTIASDMDECCLCGLSASIRSVYRTKYNINGSLCNDFMTVWCCPVCATCQLKRDIDRRKEQGIF